jgi:N-acetylglutamate synthase-like GNAT family acetyltransferase
MSRIEVGDRFISISSLNLYKSKETEFFKKLGFTVTKTDSTKTEFQLR